MASAQTGTMRLVPAGPWLYRDEPGSDLVAFKTDASGNVANAFIASLPKMVMERVAWYQSARLHRSLLGLAAAVFILTVWSALGRVIRRRFSQARGDDTLPGRGFVVGAALADLTFIVLIAVLMSNATALMPVPPLFSNSRSYYLSSPPCSLLWRPWWRSGNGSITSVWRPRGFDTPRSLSLCCCSLGR
jgi:hypothetical protein